MGLITNITTSYFFNLNKSLSEIRKDCKTIFFTPEGELFKSKGAYGGIEQVCKSRNDCNYIIKAIPLSSPGIHDTFIREIFLLPIMSELGVSPKIEDYFICFNKDL